MPILTAQLDQIAVDQTLRYRDPLVLWPGADELRRSIERVGILRPVLLHKVEGESALIPVHGFRRLELARELRLTAVPALVAAGDLPRLFLNTVESHAGSSPHNLRERARAVEVGLDLGWSLEQAAALLLPALGLEPHPELARRHLRLLDLSTELFSLLVLKGFSLRRAGPFLAFSREEGRLLARLAAGLGARRIEEAATSLLEVCARDGVDLVSLIEDLALDPMQGEGLVRLEERRYPETSRLRRQAGNLARELGGEAARVEFDRNFSRGGVELRAALKCPGDLDRLLEQLGQPQAQDLLTRLLEELD